MDLKRNFFVFLFFIFSFFVWKEYKKETFTQLDMSKEKTNVSNLIEYRNSFSKNILVKTDVLSLKINMRGGDIIEANLNNYKKDLNSKKPVRLLDTKPSFLYHAKSGLIGKDGSDNFYYNKRPIYQTNKTFFQLKKNEKVLKVPMWWFSKKNILYKKTFIFKKGQYDIYVEYDVSNLSKKKLEVQLLNELQQNANELKIQKSKYKHNFMLHTFRGSAYSSIQNRFKKHKFEDIDNNKQIKISTKNGWIAMVQQYFSTAWIPKEKNIINYIYTSKSERNLVNIAYISKKIFINPNSHKKIRSVLWIGPKIQEKMKLVAPNLDLTVDYGWLWFISQPLFKLLKYIYQLVGNWGFSIVLITLIIKLLMYPLTRAQYKSMIKMKSFQPKIDMIKEKFNDDKKRLSQEIMMLYQKEKINPFGGCLPVLIQMPIFLGLYYMLMSSIELRHAPFLLWIVDLSSYDPYYILPILMGLSMFLIQKTSLNDISDPIQKKVMYFLPFIFVFFFLWFPSGLVLYYISSNLITVIQQKFTFKN
ncbi:membrane protein insertase YidC [Buchnera aphidicola (Mindarus keteleerifoliae)]|uniref:membrane protein insertase YidC n=1 Tax=Buchnera aphidicola TaxID=9 RepID=UPI0031B6CB02